MTICRFENRLICKADTPSKLNNCEHWMWRKCEYTCVYQALTGECLNLKKVEEEKEKLNVNKDSLKELIETWKHRQTCNNQPGQNKIAKAKAHIYGICAEELKTNISNIETEEEMEKC